MKNQKIKEMEELLEMMSKKEIAKLELENLRTDIQTHHNFLKSLKKLHEESLNRPLDYSTRRSPDNTRRQAQAQVLPRRSQEVAVTAPTTSSTAPVASVALPDLINHEAGRGGAGAVGLNSPEYLYYLQQQKQLLSHSQRTSLEHSKHSQPGMAAAQFQVSPRQPGQPGQPGQGPQSSSQTVVSSHSQQAENNMMPPPGGQTGQAGQAGRQFSTNIQKFLSNSDIQHRLRAGPGGVGAVTSLQLPGGAVGVPVPPSDRQPAKSLTIRPRDFCKEVPPTSSPSSRRSPVVTRCAVCHSPANFLCSGCQKVYYCTVKCQVNSRPLQSVSDTPIITVLSSGAVRAFRENY